MKFHENPSKKGAEFFLVERRTGGKYEQRGRFRRLTDKPKNEFSTTVRVLRWLID